MKELDKLAEELGVTRRHLDRVISAAGIPREKPIVGRRTRVDEELVIAALNATVRRLPRQPRAGERLAG